MVVRNKKCLSKVARKKLDLRKDLWPEIDEGLLWDRKKTDGWLSIPRAMPLLLQIIDSLSKGKPVSSTYMDLWCRTYEDSFVIANKHREMAYYSGFNGERAVRTWMDRMKKLHELGLIDIKEGPSGPISYVLVMNPYRVVKGLHGKGLVGDGFYNALLQRVGEIGSSDLDEPQPDEAKSAKAQTANGAEK